MFTSQLHIDQHVLVHTIDDGEQHEAIVREIDYPVVTVEFVNGGLAGVDPNAIQTLVISHEQ